MPTVQHSTLSGAELHEPKGVATAGSGQVYVADGGGSGAWGSLPGTLATNHYTIESTADLADYADSYAGGTYTLEDAATYFISGEIDIGTDKIVMGTGTVIKGFSRFDDQITGTGSPLITAPNHATLADLRLSCVGGTAVRTTGSGTFLALGVTVAACAQAADIQSTGYFVGDSFSVISATTTGIVLNAATTEVKIKNSVIVVTAGSGLDLTAGSCDRVFFESNRVIVSASMNGINTAASSADINSGGAGIVESNVFTGAGTGFNGWDPADLRWHVYGNRGVAETTQNAQAYMATSTTTTIGAGDGDSGNPKLVNGATNWVVARSDQFTITTSGRLTYNGIDDHEFAVRAYVSGTSSSGTQTYNFYVAKNGTVVTASKASREFTSTAQGRLSTEAIVELSSTDYIELYIENITGTNNWDSENLNIVIERA